MPHARLQVVAVLVVLSACGLALAGCGVVAAPLAVEGREFLSTRSR